MKTLKRLVIKGLLSTNSLIIIIAIGLFIAHLNKKVDALQYFSTNQQRSLKMTEQKCPKCGQSDYMTGCNEEGEDYIECHNCGHSDFGDTFDEPEMTEPKHSPLPWRYSKLMGGFIEDANGDVVFNYPNHDIANLIVKAVNSHDKLVKALQKIADTIENIPAIRIAKQALADAEEK